PGPKWKCNSETPRPSGFTSPEYSLIRRIAKRIAACNTYPIDYPYAGRNSRPCADSWHYRRQDPRRFYQDVFEKTYPSSELQSGPAPMGRCRIRQRSPRPRTGRSETTLRERVNCPRKLSHPWIYPRNQKHIMTTEHIVQTSVHLWEIQ